MIRMVINISLLITYKALCLTKLYKSATCLHIPARYNILALTKFSIIYYASSKTVAGWLKYVKNIHGD